MNQSGGRVPAQRRSSEGIAAAEPPPANNTGLTLLKPVFREFSIADFNATPTWERLALILKGNGGSYGLYGARGSGKTWLMNRAILEAEERGGFGLLYPCPQQYSANEFLSTISDNLGHAIEQKFVRNSPLARAVRRGPLVILSLLALPLALGFATFTVHEIAHADKGSGGVTIGTALPRWLWILVLIALALVIGLYMFRFAQDSSARGRLSREATALRERIRYSSSLRTASEIGASGSHGALLGSISHSRERSLDERPTTIASLVFDFRNLAGNFAKVLNGPLVIAVDELDKIEDAGAMRMLLRDIKGIFGTENVHFLVSVSEEASSALQLGSIKPGGRNEFDSSFFTVLDLPPLKPVEARQLLELRGLENTGRLAGGLCVLVGGNRRELVRTADFCVISVQQSGLALTEKAIMPLLESESQALLDEIIRTLPNQAGASSDDPKFDAWTALPREDFGSVDKFVRLANTAIDRYWDPYWANEAWQSQQESWRRFLIRLFVAAKLLAPKQQTGVELLSEDPELIHLTQIILMAGKDAKVARSMLKARFTATLQGPYLRTTPH